MRERWIRHALKIAALLIVAVGVLGLAVMMLWNWLVPSLFGGPTIGFWQAVGVLVLSRILVGGFRGGGHHEHWRHRMRERWERMTPEERAQLRRFHSHRHWHDSGPEMPKESG
jgi:hypothetical protein